MLSVVPLLALDGSPELGRRFKEGQISLPEGAVRPQLGELGSGKLTSLEKFKPMDLVDAHANSLEPWSPKPSKEPMSRV